MAKFVVLAVCLMSVFVATQGLDCFECKEATVNGKDTTDSVDCKDNKAETCANGEECMAASYEASYEVGTDSIKVKTTEKVERLRGCYAKDYTCDKYEADLKTLNSAWGKLEIKSCNMKTCDTDKCNGAGSTLIASTLLALPLLLAIVY